MDGEKLVVIGFFTFVLPVSWMFASAYFKRWNRRMEQEFQPPPGLQAELDALRSRVGELEERLDFTERMLTQQQEDARLTEGK